MPCLTYSTLWASPIHQIPAMKSASHRTNSTVWSNRSRTHRTTTETNLWARVLSSTLVLSYKTPLRSKRTRFQTLSSNLRLSRRTNLVPNCPATNSNLCLPTNSTLERLTPSPNCRTAEPEQPPTRNSLRTRICSQTWPTQLCSRICLPIFRCSRCRATSSLRRKRKTHSYDLFFINLKMD
jgi:hypothetical protein